MHNGGKYEMKLGKYMATKMGCIEGNQSIEFFHAEYNIGYM
jgi:hypothetical protein